MLFAGCAVKHYLAEQKRSSRRVFDDASSPDIFAVPMIVWLSPEYRARNPEVASALESIAAKPVCMDELMRVFRILALLDPASLLGKH